MPNVSVVMPVWNGVSTIANAINSLINQSYDDWELIIVDDGSEDDTVRIVSQFDDHRIKYVKQNHLGIVASRNYGNSLAKGEFIMIQDADDLSLPDRIEKCLKHIGDADVLYHGLYINMWDKMYNCIGRKYVSAKPFNKEELLRHQYIPGVVFYRKSVWEKKPFRMETQFQYDWMMLLDWAFAGFKFKALDVGLYEYVRHQNSASIRFENDGRRELSRKEIAEIMKKEYGQNIGSNSRI